MVLLPSEIRGKKYCSQKCAHIAQAKAQLGTKKESRIQLDEQLRNFVLSWCDSNRGTVMDTKFNQILVGLDDLFKEITVEFKILDFRTVIRSFDTRSKKEFLKILKDYVSK